MMDLQTEAKSVDPKELARSKKARYLNGRINQCNDLARSTKDVRKWLRENAVMYWRMVVIIWQSDTRRRGMNSLLLLLFMKGKLKLRKNYVES